MTPMGHAAGCIALVLLCTVAPGQVENFVLTNDFGWNTWPASPSGCPDRVVSGKNVGSGSFYAGCSLNIARDGNGSFSDKHTLGAWFKANIFSDTNPGVNSVVFVELDAKVAATATVDLSHAETPGGASGIAKGRVNADTSSYEAAAFRNTLGNTLNSLAGELQDGWLSIGKKWFTRKRPAWQAAGGQYRTTITLNVFPSVADCSAVSPDPEGCLVQALGSAKSHFSYATHTIESNSSETTPQATLLLSDYGGNADHEVSIVYMNSSSTVTVGMGSSEVSPDGLLYAGTNLATGSYDIYVRVKGFLRKKFDNVGIDNGFYSGLSATLLNGDINGDNTVDIGDYALISTNYNLTESDTTWTRIDENFVAPKDCDVNGDGSVDVGDYAIVSANFDQEGD